MVNGRQCIQPKLDAIPTELPVRWETNGGRNPRWIPWRESIPEWMASQLNWLEQRQIPDFDHPVDMDISKNTVWIAYFDSIVRYDIARHQVSLYNFGKQDSALQIKDILVTKNHTLWAFGKHSSEKEQYAVLLQYNLEKDSFDVIDDVDSILRPKPRSRETVFNFGQDRMLKEAPNGDVLFLFRGGIYSYNPSTNKAAVIYNNPAIIISAIEADPRGLIWFTVPDDDRVWMIRPGSDQPQSFELPSLLPGTVELGGEYFGGSYTLYLDSHERLWIPGWGFLDTSKQEFTWHILNPSPLFVNLYDPDYVYTWDAANTFEAQDDSIWFTSVNGVIHYDMETEAACWISPEPGPIAESPDGSIWILLKNQLYKYEPQ